MENKGHFLHTCHIFDSLVLCLFRGRDVGDSMVTRQSSGSVRKVTAEVFQFLKLRLQREEKKKVLKPKYIDKFILKPAAEQLVSHESIGRSERSRQSKPK